MEALEAEYTISFRARAHGTEAAEFATKAILNMAFIDVPPERYTSAVLCTSIATSFRLCHAVK